MTMPVRPVRVRAGIVEPFIVRPFGDAAAQARAWVHRNFGNVSF